MSSQAMPSWSKLRERVSVRADVLNPTLRHNQADLALFPRNGRSLGRLGGKASFGKASRARGPPSVYFVGSGGGLMVFCWDRLGT